MSTVDNNKYPKKRGRPRKNQIINKKPIVDKTDNYLNSMNIKSSPKNDYEDDEIILHIPFKIEDINEISNKINKKGKSETTECTKQEQVCQLTRSSCRDQDQDQEQEVFTICNMSIDTYSDEYLCGDENSELINKLKDKDKKIKELENIIKEYKKIINSSVTSGVNETNVTKMNIEFINVENNETMSIDKTDVCCWWCTEHFDGVPCFIPEKVVVNKYYVFGCFCSYNCAAAYNVDMNDYNFSNRLSIMIKLYRDIYGEQNDLVIAPPRQSLIKFGGTLTMVEFRQCSIKNQVEYRYILPPMAPIIPFIEKSGKDNKILNKIKLSDELSDNLVLKRTKPLPNSKNTLFETMGLIIT